MSIVKINKETFDELINGKVQAIGAGLKNGDYHCYKMVSEDGTDYLQGLAMVSTLQSDKNSQCKIMTVWVDDMCRHIGFGTALMENIMKEQKNDNGIEKFICKYGAKNEVATGLFEKLGFGGTCMRGAMSMEFPRPEVQPQPDKAESKPKMDKVKYKKPEILPEQSSKNNSFNGMMNEPEEPPMNMETKDKSTTKRVK